ncbi:protein translocase subunit yajC [Desulfocicer vacuolatum DSM 3385]|uniref:Sec translocon accessory complex subunit YajC n=1 Tax=Desulfocicer vacuolatum DSM 3385 TaxID=1121400 RepID=A0A1W2B9I2_9BACT|nr:preprotein translocase subunit YajC [Desulfocicer vacuolatum]SMC69362.1 protein translocase subunit yajC [Desulfocicer vacuolatum DSM 3385]
MINTAFAMGQAGAAGGQAGGFTAFVPLILMFVIFYFLLIRPQQKKAKEHQNMINSLKKGDRIITSGGVHGTITSLGDTTVSLEIAENVKIKINRGNVGATLQTNAPAESKKGKKSK